MSGGWIEAVLSAMELHYLGGDKGKGESNGPVDTLARCVVLV